MNLTQHAAKRLAERGISLKDVEFVCANPDVTYHDKTGKPCFVAAVGGRNLKVVVAPDDPEVVITAFYQ